MNSAFKAIVLFAVAAVLCAATFILVPRLRTASAGPGIDGAANEENVQGENAETDVSGATGTSEAVSPRTKARNASSSGSSFADREQSKFDVGEMRNEVEEMVRKFRGTPEERQEVIDECEDGKELIQLFADLSESSIEKMSPDELEKERESFEKDYRAQLDFLQTGQLQRMLKTPEEEEVIGSTIEAVQEFLERIDASLQSAGY